MPPAVSKQLVMLDRRHRSSGEFFIDEKGCEIFHEVEFSNTDQQMSNNLQFVAIIINAPNTNRNRSLPNNRAASQR